jgi:hypothetical protein
MYVLIEKLKDKNKKKLVSLLVMVVSVQCCHGKKPMHAKTPLNTASELQ